jgi:hypothetical protein
MKNNNRMTGECEKNATTKRIHNSLAIYTIMFFDLDHSPTALTTNSNNDMRHAHMSKRFSLSQFSHCKYTFFAAVNVDALQCISFVT